MKCFLRFINIFILMCAFWAGQLTKSNGNLDSALVEQHVLHLEQTVADLQSRFQAQEQKQAAVLSGLLSKLTSTTDELTNVNTRLNYLEVQHNSTLLELTKANDQIKDLSNVKTELEILKKNYAVLEANLTATKSEVLVQKAQLTTVKNDVETLQMNETAVEATLKNTTKLVQKLTAVIRGRLSANVSFSSALSSAVFLKESAVVRYQHLFINVGKAYNRSTGVFTCPQSGVYTFSMHCVARQAEHIRLEIVHNNQLVVSVIAVASNPTGTASNSAIISLKVGDTVWVRSRGNSSLTGSEKSFRNTFSGHLISPTIHDALLW